MDRLAKGLPKAVFSLPWEGLRKERLRRGVHGRTLDNVMAIVRWPWWLGGKACGRFGGFGGFEGFEAGQTAALNTLKNRWPWCLAARVAESWLGNACARRCVAPSVALEKAWKGLRKAVLP